MSSTKNKVTIFLIKEGINDPEEILENYAALEVKEIKNEEEKIGDLYYLASVSAEPNWLKNFFRINGFNEISFCNSNTRAVFLTEVDNRIFALIFGYGKNLLKKDVFEDDFGLFTTLNLVFPDTLKSMDKIDLALSGKKTREQLVKSGEIKDFGVDVEQDLVSTVTGKCSEDELGGVITGRDSFHVSIDSDFKEIKNFLKQYLYYYKADSYKKDFGWIDNVKKIKDRKLLERLDEKLIEKIKSENLEKIWLAVPKIIEWSGIEGFKYSKGKGEMFEDLYLEDFKNYLGDKLSELTIKKLKDNYFVYYLCDYANGQFGEWSIYNCLYCEIELDGDYFILNNKNWYKINSDFVKDINNRFDVIPKIDLGFIDYDENIFFGKGEDKGECGYNKKIAENNDDYILFDSRTIAIGGGHSKVEFCDLFSKKDKRIIHVKIYSGSSVLSHLFNQGLVSGETFLGEEKFRYEVNKKFTEDCKLANIHSKPVADDYEIVFAIISSSDNELNLPFFSRISLSYVFKRLTTLGYRVSISKIKKIKKEKN